MAWYWRLLSVTATLMILGGYAYSTSLEMDGCVADDVRFLMLPATFEHDPESRISKQVIGIFAAAILAGGFSFTGLLTFAVRNPPFQAEAVFLPGLTSCAVGLLTVIYSFLISKRYYWNIPAYLSAIIAALGIVGYGGLMLYTYRKIGRGRRSRQGAPPSMPPLQPEESTEALVPRYQDPGYYDNYIRNMFPSSTNSPAQPPAGYNPDSITEEEMQRQQMLMLLLQQNPSTTPDASQSTFRIDWQGQDQEQDDRTPVSGSYGGATNSSGSGSSVYPLSGITRRFTDQTMQPWDGVWRDPMPASMQAPGRAQMSGWDAREERRRQIESGR